MNTRHPSSTGTEALAWHAVAGQFATIAQAPSLAQLWRQMRRLAKRLGYDGMCLIDLNRSADKPKIVLSTFATEQVLAAVSRQSLLGGAPVRIDDEVVLFPVFGAQGIEAAVALPVSNVVNVSRNEIELLLRQAIQIAYVRFCELCRPSVQAPSPLSSRECEIMHWVTLGKSNSVIAEILGISAGSVDTYMRRIFRKLGVNDRTSAAMMIRHMAA